MNSGPGNRRHISSKIPFYWRIRLYFYSFYLTFNYRQFFYSVKAVSDCNLSWNFDFVLLFLQKGLLVQSITAVSNNFRPVHTHHTLHVIQPQQGISIEFSFDAFTWQRKVPAVRKWTSFFLYREVALGVRVV